MSSGESFTQSITEYPSKTFVMGERMDLILLVIEVFLWSAWLSAPGKPLAWLKMSSGHRWLHWQRDENTLPKY